MNIALKEWASVISALSRGFHHILLRKGGIAEKGNRFEVKHKNFLLFPTFEHQKSEMIVSKYQNLCLKTLDVSSNSGSLTFEVWAEVKEAFVIHHLDQLKQLSSFHIWSDEYLKMRFDYKPERDLYLLLLRTFKLFEKKKIKDLPQYGGCRSWVELKEDVSTESSSHVLSEREFEKIQKEIQTIIGKRGVGEWGGEGGRTQKIG